MRREEFAERNRNSSLKKTWELGLLFLLLTSSMGIGCATVQKGVETSMEQVQLAAEQVDRMLEVPSPEQWLQKPQAQSDSCVICLQLCCNACSVIAANVSVTSPLEEGLSSLADLQEAGPSMSMAF